MYKSAVQTLLAVILFVASNFVVSCKKDLDPVFSLDLIEFENDSVVFDTVFTSIGSATEVFIIYNRAKYDQYFDEITLAGGQTSPYRLNIDGVPGYVFKNVKIPAGDSLFCFADVTIDPNSEANPFVVTDSILFSQDGAAKDIKLVSWGQNAYFHYNTTIAEDQTWNSDKPHILFGEVLVAKGATLRILACATVRAHALSRLNIGRGSSLMVEGTAECPVVFEGDRLEERFKEEPGQWIGIRLLPGAGECIVNQAIIKNGLRGIEVDSMRADRSPNLFLENTTITTMTQVCLLGYTASLVATNCDFNNSCGFLAVGELGGAYQFAYCTFGNYQVACARTDPSVYLSNADYTDPEGNIYINPLEFNILNCIIYGSQEDELGFNQSGKGAITASIAHTLIRSKMDGLDLNGNKVNQDPKFENTTKLKYALMEGSAALEMGIPVAGVTTDKLGQTRDTQRPDAGAYEWVK
jgi:hypothetical protein